jgi:hypothetical protein
VKNQEIRIGVLCCGFDKESWQGQDIFHFFTVSRLALGVLHQPVQWVPQVLVCVYVFICVLKGGGGCKGTVTLS